MSKKDRKDKKGKKTMRTFDELVASAITEDGAIDLSKIAEATPVGENGGVKCDVTSGPCSCGAWH